MQRSHYLTIQKLHLYLEEGIQSGSTTATTNTTTISGSNFNNNNIHDCIQALTTCSRPAIQGHDAVLLGKHVAAAVAACESSVVGWKLLILAVIRRRFHRRAPEAKAIINKTSNKRIKISTNKKEEEDLMVEGDGERLFFYCVILCLYKISKKKDHPSITTTSSARQLAAAKACLCLCELALPAGGSRDLCSLLEHIVYERLQMSNLFLIQNELGSRKALCDAVRTFVLQKDTATTTATAAAADHDDQQEDAVLEFLLKSTAELLDHDIQLVRKQKQGRLEGMEDTARPLQSTINTFIPHHNRGGKKNAKDRRLAQTIAELLIWSRTSTLCDTWTSVLLRQQTNHHQAENDIDDAFIVQGVHQVQTRIRRLRKELNDSARQNGFFLSSSFQMDPNSLTLPMVRRGKEDDVSNLNVLATKKRNAGIVRLISKRFADPKKALPIKSISQLRRQWISLSDAGQEGNHSVDDGGQGLKELDLMIQEASIRATIKLLQSKMKPTSLGQKTVIASLDKKVECDAAAILLAAALNEKFVWDDLDSSISTHDSDCSTGSALALFLGEKEQRSVTSIPAVMSFLNEIFEAANEPINNGEPATTKEVQNLIDRHVGPQTQLLLMSSTNVKLEERQLANLQKQKSSIHCHILDTMMARLDRERAKNGDITISLAWDNGCDLDLHVLCPNGDHISYQNKEGGINGYLDVDMNAGGPQSYEPVENVAFGDEDKGIEAPRGDYKVMVENYAYHDCKKGEAIPWRVRVSMNKKHKMYHGECIGSGRDSKVTAVEFTYNGRVATRPQEVGSALESSNLVAVTSSIGDTVDSLCQLMLLRNDHDELREVGQLTTRAEAKEDDQVAENVQVMAADRAFGVSNRDRLFLLVSKLPSRFHQIVSKHFGGESLSEVAALSLAERLRKEKIPVSELNAGYPKDIVDLVAEKMAFRFNAQDFLDDWQTVGSSGRRVGPGLPVSI